MTTSKSPTYYVYTVIDHNEKSFWTRIGSAWNTKNGGISIDLFALPLKGRIVCNPPKEDAPTETAPAL